VNYAGFAELIGLKGIRVETPDQIEGAWDEAFSADRPCVVDALCDPNVPPLPPHITVKEAKSFVSALKKGDPHMRGVITQSFKEKIIEFLPGR
jgi:pyruvate dehydrogenase (quinone)